MSLVTRYIDIISFNPCNDLVKYFSWFLFPLLQMRFNDLSRSHRINCRGLGLRTGSNVWAGPCHPIAPFMSHSEDTWLDTTVRMGGTESALLCVQGLTQAQSVACHLLESS